MIVGFDASRAQVSERAGPENYTYNLLKELLRVDHKNFYRLYYNPRASNLQLTRSARFWLSPKAPSDSQPRTSNFELRTITWPKLWTQGGLALECLREPPDVLFIPAHTIPLLRRPNLKTVVTIHDVGFQKFLEQYQRRWWRLYGGRISNFAARAATHVIAVSESTKKDLIEKLGVRPDKITVIYEGVNHEIFRQQFNHLAIQQLRRKYGIDNEYLLFVGTIQPRKNLVRLIEAFQQTQNSLNSQISLVIVGKKGWLCEEIYEAPKKFGVEDKVKFLGYIPTDDVVTLLNGAKFFVLPSLYEGFGLVVLEAMACGCPVLTSNTSSLPEVVGSARGGSGAGILVDPYSVEDIARGIGQVLELNETQRRSLVEKGLKQAQRFTWQKAAKETIEVFELCSRS